MLKIAAGVFVGLVTFACLCIIIYIGFYVILFGLWTEFFDAAGFVAS